MLVNLRISKFSLPDTICFPAIVNSFANLQNVMMKNKIADHLRDPEMLEQLYRENRRDFSREFPEAAQDADSELIRFWKIRLKGEGATGAEFSLADLAMVIVIALVTALLVKLPHLFPAIPETFFYTRNLAIIVFNGLIVYTFLQNKKYLMRLLPYGSAIVALLLYLNLLPDRESDAMNIAFMHVPLFLWCLFGLVFISFDAGDSGKRMAFIRFNGELITMAGLLLITGGILTGITIGLFSAIGMNIEQAYFNYIALPGSTAAPVLASYLIRLYPDITRRIVPVIARVFTPIVLVTLVIYIVTLAFSGIRILEDRNLLILFNVMLVAVMAIIVFSVTELDKNRDRNIQVMILLILAVVTLVINAVALTAITTRLTYGLTPNRLVVFITNVLVFVNLILIAKDLYRSWFDARRLESVGKTVANYLTVYFLWTVFAIFILPALFGF